MKLFSTATLATLMCAMFAAPTALAAGSGDSSATLPDWISTFKGQVRIYEFHRLNNGNVDNPSVRGSFSAAGNIFIQTKSVQGFSLGLGVYSATDLGLGPIPSRRDGSLMGNDHSFSVPTEAYVQYDQDMIRARLGNQMLKTPWVWGSDSRVIPATFQGFSVAVNPNKQFTVEAGYMRNWKNRTATAYSKTTLYGVDSPDFSYAGVQYGDKFDKSDLKVQGWIYQFTDIANMVYLQANWRYHTGGAMDPVAAVQFAHESDTGAALLGKVDAKVSGVEFGVAKGPGTYTIAFNSIPASAAAFQNGNIVSPYTHSYATDPLFTTSMTQGLADQSTSGKAIKLKGVYWFGENRNWRLIGSYARYDMDQFTKPGQTGKPSEIDIDGTYFVRSGTFKGVSIRDRIGIFTYPGAPKTFIYNRLQFQYNF